jgi:phospholipid/cholesterol/gamma-HCH transport system substrate-binding protein
MHEPPALPEPPPREDPAEGLDQRFKFRRVNEITGVFVLAVLAVLIAVVVWTGHSQRWFRSKVTLRITLPESGAAGIRQGSEVYFLGTRVGSVSDVIVDTAGRMEARTSIRHDFFLFVRADSSAVVKRTFGLAGDSFFEITRGQGQPLPEQNATIVCKDQMQSPLESAVEEIRRETVLVLKKTSAGLDAWTELGTNLLQSEARLEQLLVHADDIAADLQQGKGTIGQLLNDSSAADGLKTLLVKANQSADELKLTLNNLESASGNIQQATTNLPSLSADLDRDAREIPALILQTQSSMVELERVFEAVERHWLLRKYVNRTNPPPLRPIPAGGKPEKKPVKTLLSPRNSASGHK